MTAIKVQLKLLLAVAYGILQVAVYCVEWVKIEKNFDLVWRGFPKEIAVMDTTTVIDAGSPYQEFATFTIELWEMPSLH